MSELYLILILIFSLLFFGLLFFVAIRKEIRRDKKNESLLYLKQDIESIRKEIGDGVWKNIEINQKQSKESKELIREITEELIKVSEGQKQVLGITDQLKNLQDMLKNPQQRGAVGEFFLETLLKNVMPPNLYQMQYSFSDNSIVDAVIFVNDIKIPIDSKFSLKNYNLINESSNFSDKDGAKKNFIKDLKVRISETAKYIKPEEGTTDFAFMFIPHEAIYYDLLINKIGSNSENLVQRAAGKDRVIIVSPTSFLAYLQTVLQGLNAMKIEASAKQIKKRVEDLQKHLSSYQDHMNSLGRSIDLASNYYNKASNEFTKIDKDIYKITDKNNLSIKGDT